VFNCVYVIIRFRGNITEDARFVGINIYQEDATEFTFPWFSLVAQTPLPGLADPPEKSKEV
jgi:hypothetical protein